MVKIVVVGGSLIRYWHEIDKNSAHLTWQVLVPAPRALRGLPVISEAVWHDGGSDSAGAAQCRVLYLLGVGGKEG